MTTNNAPSFYDKLGAVLWSVVISYLFVALVSVVLLSFNVDPRTAWPLLLAAFVLVLLGCHSLRKRFFPWPAGGTRGVVGLIAIIGIISGIIVLFYAAIRVWMAPVVD